MTHWNTLDGRPTRVIAHRGASGELPEHTLTAYRHALEQGADVVEPDLVISRDGELIVRHDRGLKRSTDIAQRPEFGARQCDGDWWIEQFDREELASLHAVQPFAQRDRSHDGRHPIPSFRDALVWAQAEARGRGAPVCLYPELKHPALFAAAGLDPVPRFIEVVRGVDPALITLWVQCFEFESLQRVREATGLPVFLLPDEQADWRALLVRHAPALTGFGVAKSQLSAELVDAVHEQGLAVHVWTYRDDVLPPGVARVEDELEFAFALGVDAVFCDFPATALRCRQAFTQARSARTT